MLSEENIRKIVRETFQEIESMEMFKNISPGDLDFDSKASAGHMQIYIRFFDDHIQGLYSKLMIEEFDEPDTIIDIETNNMNNIHINAIPTVLRGIGLGKTIYRKVLEEFDFISTGFHHARISEDAQRVWESLIKSGEYYYFIGTEHIRVTAASKDTHPLIYKTIINYYGDNLESTNFSPEEVDDWDEY